MDRVCRLSLIERPKKCIRAQWKLMSSSVFNLLYTWKLASSGMVNSRVCVHTTHRLQRYRIIIAFYSYRFSWKWTVSTSLKPKNNSPSLMTSKPSLKPASTPTIFPTKNDLGVMLSLHQTLEPIYSESKLPSAPHSSYSSVAPSTVNFITLPLVTSNPSLISTYNLIWSESKIKP